jgi:pyruvate formate lyase activating enzyme
MQTRDVQMEDLRGLIYNLQRFAIHDGPGIRTLVYMKGCPLECLWCSTPQTQKMGLEILYNEVKCRKCRRCVEVCPLNLITLSKDKGVEIDRALCTNCGRCFETCPNQALGLLGSYMTVAELFREVDKDSPFYRRSNGGVTVGGGEPTMQYKFVAEFLKKCKQRYIHTAMETCGYVGGEHLEKLLKHLDLVYFDIKHMDAQVHKDFTGASNELILENARRACARRPMIVRIPLVPGLNDSDDNILDTAVFARKLGKNLKRIELLPYHKFGTQTYGRMGREYRLVDVKPPSDDHLRRLQKMIESCGVSTQIGG